MKRNHDTETQAIRSRLELAAFVRGLHAEFSSDPTSWQNRDLGSFLEAMAGWLDDMDGYHGNRGETSPRSPEWRTFAEVLAAARYYE